MATFNEQNIEVYYPQAVMYRPMNISSPPKDLSILDSGEWFGQIKKDGCWYMYEKHKNHSYLFSRTTSTKTSVLVEKGQNVPHIMKALDEALPADTILIGEIYYPGKSSKDCIKIMGSSPEKAIMRQREEYGLIHYYLHDVLMLDGEDFVAKKIDNSSRYKKLKELFSAFLLEGSFIELAESFGTDLTNKISEVLEEGEEGMVFKKKDGLYLPNKRPSSMFKIKKVSSEDLIIMGFEEPIAEYKGKDISNWKYWEDVDGEKCFGEFYWDGLKPITKAYFMEWTNSVLILGAYNECGKLVRIGTVSSGISDNMKRDMTKNPEDYLNQVVEITFMEKDCKEQTFRHPRFTRMRPDKNAEDCQIKKIFFT